jgi:hypothetical protein
MQLMELEIERKPQEIRCEGRKLPAQLNGASVFANTQVSDLA